MLFPLVLRSVAVRHVQCQPQRNCSCLSDCVFLPCCVLTGASGICVLCFMYRGGWKSHTVLIPFFYRANRGVCGGLITVTSLSKSIEHNSRYGFWLHGGKTSEVPEETMQFQTKRCRHDNEKDIIGSLTSAY